MKRKFLPLALLLIFAYLPLAAENSPAEKLIILVNENDPDSVALGEFYAEKRNVPAENIVALPAPTRETITWATFIDEIFNPLQRELIDTGWIEGTPSQQKGNEGRFRHHLTGHRMSYLVVCRGIPLRIEHDEDRMTAEMESRVQEAFRTNAASVDSELSLLALGQHPIVALVQNPLFQNDEPDRRVLRSVIKVSRLDGPSAADARRLVESALEAEEEGLRGRAYVDVLGAQSGEAAGAAARGEEWLRDVAEQLRAADWNPVVREEPGTFRAADRFDAPAIYFGWYARDVNGPFAQEGFTFPPGAIALHIHSFSARTLRSPDAGWAGPFVARGAAATVGNVYEPYLQLTHQPHLFLRRLLAGDTIADAAYYALPALSWQGVLLGDPLYRPFRVSHEEKMERARNREFESLDEYVFLREVNRLVEAEEFEEAIDVGHRGFLRSPGLALGLEVAQLRAATDQSSRVMATLQFVDMLETVSPRNAGLAQEVAEFLAQNGERERALAFYDLLVNEPRFSPVVRRALLQGAVELAESENDSAKAHRWRENLGALD